jgi:hypothetical protein
LSTVKRQRWAWEEEKERAATVAKSDCQAAAEAATMPPETLDAAVAVSLPLFATVLVPDASASEASGPDLETPVDDEARRVAAEQDVQGGSPFDEGEDTAEELRVQHGTPVRGGHVQHLGAWLMLAMAEQFGLYEGAAKVGGEWTGGPRPDALRIALDAILSALAVGEGNVEGVRRLGTPTAPLLLRAHHAPSASWTRRIVHAYADRPAVAGLFQAHVTGRLLRDAQGDEVAVFYVDNHLRPYTGRHVVRRGWRMQDKRVRPGATDFYIHDEDGRPIERFVSPANGPLTAFLSPVGKRLREALGADQRILLSFDRGGAYPEQMAELRDAGLEFVTYERRPYPQLTPSAFDRVIEIDGEPIGLYESAARNLGRGRGRVRRIALRMSDGLQINLLACSREPAERLVAIMIGDDDRCGRWVQENALKHGVERWGINQLDGRRIERYDPDTIVPNPARRRLDRALHLAMHREGLILRELALLPADHRRREQLKQDLASSRAEQRRLEALRPDTPRRAALRDTELADRLVRHLTEYKTVLDTVRIVAANIETELAARLAAHLPKPREAKKLLANLFAAPGRVTVSDQAIHVTLAPAATARERSAIAALLRTVNRDRLSLPDDVSRRRLTFALHS